MKTITLIFKYIKAYFILLVSGWRSIEVFGYPPIYKKKDIKIYLVTSGDGTIIDVCQYYGKRKGKHQWQQSGFCHDMYPEYREVTLWKFLNNEQRWSFIACK